jgi:hypothetical protein
VKKNRSLVLVTAVVVLFATLFLAVPRLEAICGDCAIIDNEPFCVSPPPDFEICTVAPGWMIVVVMGRYMKVWGETCQVYATCAE